MTLEEMLARAAMQKALAACTQAGDARKAAIYASCFAEDGVLDLGTVYQGRAAIRQWMEAPSPIGQPAGAAPGYVSHHLTTCRIDLTSPTAATARTYWLVTTAAGLDHTGYYDDRFRAVADDWLIAWRRPRTLWVSAASLIATRP